MRQTLAGKLVVKRLARNSYPLRGNVDPIRLRAVQAQSQSFPLLRIPLSSVPSGEPSDGAAAQGRLGKTRHHLRQGAKSVRMAIQTQKRREMRVEHHDNPRSRNSYRVEPQGPSRPQNRVPLLAGKTTPDNVNQRRQQLLRYCTSSHIEGTAALTLPTQPATRRMMQVGPPNADDDLTLHTYMPCNDDGRRTIMHSRRGVWVSCRYLVIHFAGYMMCTAVAFDSRSNINRSLPLHNICSVGISYS